MQQVPDRFDFPQEEEKILQLWKDIDAFQTSIKLSEGRPSFNFYDGPPFATGLPHYGHVLAGTIKDIVTRYAHNTGHYVERRFGWDCHGLPIEFEIDKMYNVRTKEQVMEMGIDNYNEKCRSIVMRYSSEWEEIVGRLGRWIDFENDYKTMDIDFMESVWWVFKTLYEKGLVYRGFKVMPYSTGCTTPLSNFEANENYQDVTDITVVASFQLVEDPDVSFVAWTTTPWTLPSNMSLCVNPNLTYCKLKDAETGKLYILMEDRIVQLYQEENQYEILETFPGESLIGKQYVPLFNYFSKEEYPNAFTVIGGSYVTNESGTGIVHCAPAFGEEDYNVCMAADVVTARNIPCPVDDNGRFTDPVSDFKGMYIKVADKEIIKTLTEQGKVVSTSPYKHSYPFCWRSDTPLIYRAVPSWFVNVESITDRLVANNDTTYWVPDFVGEKRFKNWLLNARDWAISRNRYWGTPIPIWASEDFEEIIVVGSVAELEELTGTKVTDLHKHHVDQLEIISPKTGNTLRRIEEVFDCWFESGSMPYAQQHYPFENKEKFEANFPADFIAEGIDQTRGWFYTLLVLSTALFDKPPFKNLIVNGMVLASDGKKMSKRLKNYPPVMDVVNSHGADALRLYLINSPVVRAQKLKFKEEGVQHVIRDVFLRWYNAYRLFVQTILALPEFTPSVVNSENATNIMDRWILAYSHGLIKYIREEMEGYRLYTVVPRLVEFITDLANWYVRLNRTRLKGNEGKEEQQIALSTLYSVLMNLCKMMAPFTPFFVENLYQNLVKLAPEEEQLDSVHYTLFPEFDATLLNEDIERAVKLMQNVIELGRIARERRTLPLKTPVRTVRVYVADEQAHEDIRTLESYILEELNTLNIEVVVGTNSSDITLSVKLDGKALGPKLRRDIQKAQKEAAALTNEQILDIERNGSVELAGYTIKLKELFINRKYVGDASKWEASGNTSAIVLIDTELDEELILGGFTRELMNRVQRLRKQAGLTVTQKNVEVYYQHSGKDSERIDLVLASSKGDIEEATGTVLIPSGEETGDDLVEATTEVGDSVLTLKLRVPSE
eukprot:TRINITY_DN3088_c0_g1_i1.p1 TRINITY_DN3088_c0_g1~~TRINITY_DN3088_c0_g1_i1.p1  ORF type:complete len:1072 (-),score=281.44 TRINITY_DN3088_c0_g1_i1:18-3203(-)